MDLFESMMQGHRELNESRENGLRNFTIEFENPYRRYESETADYQATSPEEALDKFLAEFGEDYKDKIYLIYDESDYEWFIDQKTGELRPTEEFDMYQELDDSPAYFTQEDELNDVFGECVQESTELDEAFSSSLPQEVVDVLAKKYWSNPKDALLKKGLDLANLKYVDADPPTSNRDPILKDPNKICFFILDDNGREKVYIPYYYHVYLFSEDKETNQLPWKTILAHAKRFGYVDLTDPENNMLAKRRERKAIDRSADRDPKMAQQKRDDGTWRDFAFKGYDKNGYKVDSQKYQRMLDTLGEDNYKEVMAKYGDRINSMADRIADLLKDRRNSSNYRNLDYIDSAIRGLRDASSSFEELGKTIDRYYEWSQKDGDEGARFKERYPSLKDYLESGWNTSAESLRNVRKELAYADDYLKKIQNKSESVKVESTDLSEDTEGVRKRQLRHNVEEVVDEYLNSIYDGYSEEFKSNDELVKYVYGQIFDMKSNGDGYTRYGRGICDDLKYLGKDYIVKEIIRIGNEEGVVATEEVVEEESADDVIKIKDTSKFVEYEPEDDSEVGDPTHPIQVGLRGRVNKLEATSFERFTPEPSFRVGDIIKPAFDDEEWGQSVDERWRVVEVGEFDKMNGFRYVLEPANEVAQKVIDSDPTEFSDGVEIFGFESHPEEGGEFVLAESLVEDFYVGWAKMKDPAELKQWLKDNPTHSIYRHSDGSYYIGSSEKDPYSMELDRDIVDTLRQDEFFKDMLKEDTVKKKNGKWTNRGDNGKEHGEFNTKKEADKQRKAMFANGYKAESKKRVMKEASIPGDNYSVYQCTFDVAVPQEMRLYGLSGQSDGAFFKDLSKFLEDHGMVMAGDEISAIDMTNEYEEIFAEDGGIRQYFFGESLNKVDEAVKASDTTEVLDLLLKAYNKLGDMSDEEWSEVPTKNWEQINKTLKSLEKTYNQFNKIQAESLKESYASHLSASELRGIADRIYELAEAAEEYGYEGISPDPNTYGIGVPFIGTYEGYVDLSNPEKYIDSEKDEYEQYVEDEDEFVEEV